MTIVQSLKWQSVGPCELEPPWAHMLNFDLYIAKRISSYSFYLLIMVYYEFNLQRFIVLENQFTEIKKEFFE